MNKLYNSSIFFLVVPVTRMKVQGEITATFNVVLKDFYKLGYDNGDKK